MANHAGAIPADAPVIMHGLEEEVGPAGVRAGGLPLPLGAGGRHGLVARRRRARPPRQRLPPPARSSSNWCWSFPKAPRAPASCTPSATGCAASAGAGSSRSPCGPGCRSSRSRWSAARRPCRRWPRRPGWRKLLRVPYVPLTANMLPARAAGPGHLLPGQVQAAGPRPGPLRRARPTRSGTRAAGCSKRPRPSARTCRPSLYRHAPAPPQRVVRLIAGRGQAGADHGAVVLLGRPPGPGLRAGPEHRRHRRHGHRRSGRCPGANRVRPHRRELLDPGPAGPGDAGRHRVHAALVVDSTVDHRPQAPREQRDRHHEPARRRRPPSDSQVQSLVVKSSTLVYGSSPRDPTWFREDTRAGAPPARTRLERSLVEAESYLRSFAEENPAREGGGACAAPTSSATTSSRRFRGLSDPALRPRRSRASTRSCSSSSRTTSSGPSSSSSPTGCEGVYNVAGGRTPAVVGDAGDRRSTAPCCSARFATDWTAAALGACGVVNLPPETLDLLRFGRGVDNRKLKGAGFDIPLHDRRSGPALRRGAAAAPGRRRDRADTTDTRATSNRSFGIRRRSVREP